MADECEDKFSDPKKIKIAWNEFIKMDKVKQGVVRNEILESWRRCKSYGLDPNAEKIITDISDEEKSKILTENKTLIDTARPFLENLFDVINELELLVYLTNKDCIILYAIGKGPIWEYSKNKVSTPGGSLHERYAGTTTVGLAIELDKPFQMIGEEHYLKLNRSVTCAAAPIHGAKGEIIGALDVTASYKIAQKHSYALGMILAGAKVIESQIRLQKEFEKSFLANQYFNAAIESMGTGFLILDQDNTINHFNQAAEKILGISTTNIKYRKIEHIINNKDILEVFHKKRKVSNLEVLLMNAGEAQRCLVSLRPIFDTNGNVMGNVLFLRELANVQKLVQKVIGFKAEYTFQDIWGESPEIQKTLELAKNIAKSPSNVIITGESGTGKEMLAQSIHNESLNSSGPFLAINCASIPHDLIESELFGYEAGTFTGGLRDGKSGKLEIANGGTLFLDEINGMSLQMQAKLLRVLEEKKFLRLGGKSYSNLDARIIVATNKDLQQEMKKGVFRSDLFYRLSIFEIHVPPLRERKEDIKFLVHRFVKEISGKVGKKVEEISPEAITYLEHYNWPGNVRELKNWIERAVYLSEGSILTIDNFSQDTLVKTRADTNYPKAMREDVFSLIDIEMDAIKAALEECCGNISQACKRLGIGRASLYRKLHKYNFRLSKVFSPRDN